MQGIPILSTCNDRHGREVGQSSLATTRDAYPRYIPDNMNKTNDLPKKKKVPRKSRPENRYRRDGLAHGVCFHCHPDSWITEPGILVG